MNIKKIIREEMDDLQWIRDVSLEYKPRIGDYLEIVNLGSEKSFKNWLSSYTDKWLNGDYGNTIKGSVIGLGKNESAQYEKTFILQEERTRDKIHFPLKEEQLRLGKINSSRHSRINFINLKLDFIYLSNKTELQIDESNDLEWIKDVDDPFIITTTPFEEVDTYDAHHRYWVSKGIPIKVGDFVVYKTASGIWREYGIMNPEKVDEANDDEDFYSVIVNPI